MITEFCSCIGIRRTPCKFLFMCRSGRMYEFLALSPVFKVTSLSMHALDQPFKPRDRGARPRWLGYVRNHALRKRLEHLRRPETTSASTASSLEETERNHEGLNPGNTLLCRSSRPRIPLFARRVVQAPKTLGRQMLMYRVGQMPHDRIWQRRLQLSVWKVLLDLFNFTGGLSSRKSQTEDCCLVSGSYWYTEVSLPVTMSQTRSDLPPSNFRSKWRHYFTLPPL